MTAKRTHPMKEAFLLLASALFFIAAPLQAVTEDFDFTVYLDKKEVGRQTFTLTDNGEEQIVRIEANFDVKLLFVTFYRYRYTNEEVWKDGCLQSISSATSDGGEDFFVSGEKRGDLLTGATLLNSQTGKMDRVRIEDLGEQTIDVRGVTTKTDCRRIVSDEFTIVLWYAGDDWVALESTTADGNRLYYAIR